jgi:Domain of unknown function (DUF4349)
MAKLRLLVDQQEHGARHLTLREPLWPGVCISGRRVPRAWRRSDPHKDLARGEVLDDGGAAMACALPACASSVEEPSSDGATAVEDRAVGASEPEPAAEVATNGQVGAAQDVSGTLVPPEDFDRKIVKTAELGVTSEYVRGEAAAAQQVASHFGGTIISSRTYRLDNVVSADLILFVPSEHFEDALDDLRDLGADVTTDTVSGQDVTE